MADPLALSVIFNRLPIATVEWTLQRNDEFSGLGTGDVWTTEIADPLWAGDVTLGRGLHDELKQAAALIRRLGGARQSFMLCDPTSLFPQADPAGTILGASNVTVRAVTGDRNVGLFQGLPPAYRLTVGDKVQVTNGTLRTFHEVSETIVGTAGGLIDVQLHPWLPLSLPAGAIITLIRPACPVIVAPNTHKPGVSRRSVTEGAGFRVLQKKRA